MESYQKVWKVNHSLVITIPRQAIEEKDLRKGQYVRIDWDDVEKMRETKREPDIHDAIGGYITGETPKKEEIILEKKKRR